ncbi:MAG: type II CAAX endopeptidase family protein [Eubacteriales bacterium]|nr:type II CAAX endopeptidase family protein [Eubacteriales bacterium]
MTEIRKHFSRLGLAYLAGSLIIYAVQLAAFWLLDTFAPVAAEDPNISFLAGMLTMYAVAMPLMALLIRRLPAAPVASRPMTKGQGVTAFLMCYGLMYAGNLAGQLVTLLIGLAKGSDVVNPVLDTVTGLNLWVTFAVTVLLAPVTEEYLFRKLLVERTVRYGEGVAVLCSGLVFGLFHGNLNQFAYAFLLGLFLAYLYVKTGRLRYTILIHMAINFVGSVLPLWLLEKTGYSEIMASLQSAGTEKMALLMENLPGLTIFGSYASLVLLTAAAGIILLFVSRRKFVCRPGASGLSKKQLAAAAAGSLGMILYGVFWIGMMLAQAIG